MKWRASRMLFIEKYLSFFVCHPLNTPFLTERIRMALKGVRETLTKNGRHHPMKGEVQMER